MLDASLRQVLDHPPGPATLAAVIDRLRPAKGAEPAAALRAAIAELESDRGLLETLRATLSATFADAEFVQLLSESGIMADRGLSGMIARSLTASLLPADAPPTDARRSLAKVFAPKDWRWVNAISASDWAQLTRLCVGDRDLRTPLHDDLELAIRRLTLRLAAAGMHEEVDRKLSFVEHDERLFVDLPREIDAFLEAAEDQRDDALQNVRARLRLCRKTVRRLRHDKATHGTSLQLTRLSRRIEQQVQRLELLLCLEHPRDESQQATVLASLFKRLVTAEQSGNRLSRRMGQVIDQLAYQITEHTAAKGAKYTQESKGTYAKILFAAMGGGAIVGVFAILKLYASKLSLSLAAQAFVYGLNYAACFVVIYLCGATLATKQPAITASAIAKQLDERESRQEGLEQVADSVVYVWRNQFVSFLGNLLCAFPIALLFGLIVERAFGLQMVDADKARALLEANHPTDGPTLFYAAVAGVFLFLAGLVQGAVDNRVVYTRLQARISQHPRLAWMGSLRARLANSLSKHAGGLTSNIVLGFLLGSAGVVGVIFGLPIDIRHIAFSSAHVGVAVLDAPELLTWQEGAVVVLGVLAIGLVNFLVSFGLTLAVTLKSRQVTVTQGGTLLLVLLKRFARRPLEWFLPLQPRPVPQNDPTD